MTKWIVYATKPKSQDGGTCSIEKSPLRPNESAERAAQWRGGRLLGVQPNERKAESFRRLIELQAQLQGYPVVDS
jgi:hypothetical protein